jgi:hypothetical protein
VSARRIVRTGAGSALVIGLAMAGGWIAYDGALAADGTSGGPSSAASVPDDTGEGSSGDGGGPQSTAAVERRDLITREEYDGTLGYTDERAVSNRGQGTLTWIAEEGSLVRPGAILYRVDTRPVFWLSGGQPAWRTLEDGIDDGLHVRQLEQNLVALGFDPDREIEVDTEFDDATEDAIERWQEKTHQEETGTIELGTVVFLPGQLRRVADVQGTVGGGAGGAILSTTSTRREATFEIDAREAGQVQEGKAVQVELPDGTVVGGRIAHVGRVATGGSDDPAADDDPTIEVTVRLEAGKGVDAFDQAPVLVRVETEAERDALAVPVGALLALAGGGYALELADSHRLVPVEVGAFADGYVQVTGDGIDEGTRVVQADL